MAAETGVLERLIQACSQLALPDLQAGLRESFVQMGDLLGVVDAALLLFDADGRVQWCTIRERDETDDVLEIGQAIQQRGLENWTLRNRQLACVEDVTEDSRWRDLPDYAVAVRSALSVPVVDTMDNNRALAVMTFTYPQPDYFTLQHQQLAALYAERVHDTIRSSRLSQQVVGQHMRFSALMESVTDMLLLLDRQGNVLVVNHPALRLLDINTPNQAIGKNLTQMILPDETLTAAIHMIRHGVIGEPYEFRSEQLRSTFVVQLSTWAEGYVLRVRDLGRIDELERFKDELLRLASNDLRSSLALIIGYAHMIGLDTPDPASPVHKHIEIIEDATTRMNRLLEDLLRVEQIRQSPLELQEQIDPGRLVKIVMVNMRFAAESKDLSFVSTIQLTEDAHILADPVLIRQAMEKLVENAIQYTLQGGEVQVNAYVDAGRFYFVVTDTGIGIPEEHISHVFEPFYRWESKGAGLGLSLVQDVIERHEGTVWLESTVGKGSTFGFWLPLSGVQ